MKNKKIKLINLLNLIALIIEFIIMLIISIWKKDWLFTYKQMCIALALSGVINFIFLLIKEIKFITYDSKKYTPFIFIAHSFFSILCYYVAIFIEFNDYCLLLWCLLILVLIIPLIVFPLLNYFIYKKNKDNKPKFIVNK